MARQRHIVRQHFTIFKHSPTKETAVCKYCSLRIGFSVLRGKQHLRKCHHCPHEVIDELSSTSPDQNYQITSTFYQWIHQDDVPQDIIESNHFQAFVSSLNGNWELPNSQISKLTISHHRGIDISIDNLIN